MKHPSIRTSVTRHHCDSCCASQSIAVLKQEHHFYTCICSYFQASLFLWCLCDFQQVTHCFKYFFLNNSLPSYSFISIVFLSSPLLSILSQEAPLAAKPS